MIDQATLLRKNNDIEETGSINDSVHPDRQSKHASASNRSTTKRKNI